MKYFDRNGTVFHTEARRDMSIPNTKERKVRPTHPGEMLREDFLADAERCVTAG